VEQVLKGDVPMPEKLGVGELKDEEAIAQLVGMSGTGEETQDGEENEGAQRIEQGPEVAALNWSRRGDEAHFREERIDRGRGCVKGDALT